MRFAKKRNLTMLRLVSKSLGKSCFSRSLRAFTVIELVLITKNRRD